MCSCIHTLYYETWEKSEVVVAYILGWREQYIISSWIIDESEFGPLGPPKHQPVAAPDNLMASAKRCMAFSSYLSFWNQ